ncbi:MAG: hypothetical protein QXP01_04040, partial [Candidatus Hadarchaeum sp.]
PSDTIRRYSTIRQIVQIPADASNPILSFWYYPVSGDTANDLQYVRVVASGKAEWVLRECSNAQSWLYKSYPLDDFKGYEVSIYFTVVNDGTGGVTAMYVDDVSLWTCGTQSVLSNRVFLPILLRTAEESLSPASYPETMVAALGASTFSQAIESEAIDLQRHESVPEISAWGSNMRVLWQTDESSGPDVIQGIVLNPANNLLYMGIGKAIWVIEARSGEVVARIPLPAIPYGLAVDAMHNRVYAALQEMDALAVINNAQQRLLAVVPGIPGASGVALGGGYIYVTAARSDELVVVNGQNYAIMKRVPVGATPYAVLYDLGLQRVYVGNAGDDTVSVIDGRDWTLVSLVKLGGLGHPHGLALDPIREHLYVTYALSPKHRAIAVVDTLSGRVISSLQGSENETLSGAYGVAVDPLRGEVYVTTADKLLVLAEEPLRIVQSIVGIGPAYAFGVAAAPLERRVYLADGRHNRLVVIQ